MESSTKSVFLGSDALWILAFSCRDLGKQSYLERKQEGIVGFCFLEDMSDKLPKCSFVFLLTWNYILGDGERAAA